MKPFITTIVILCVVAFMSYNTKTAKSNRLFYAIDKCVDEGGYIDYVDAKKVGHIFVMILLTNSNTNEKH